jgi:HPt (histidine-containing phosphotransfer) domain-containing protein
MTDEAPVVDLPILEGLRALQSEREPALVAELVEEFLTRAPLRIARMQAALTAGDAAALAFEAHGLAGSCGVLGVLRLRIRCRDLEELALKGALGQASAALDEVNRSLAEAGPVLREAARRG